MNTQTQEALKMAIEQMQHLIKIYIPSPEWSGTAIQEDCYETIQACKEALKPHPDCDEACMYQCEMERKHQQPAQEHIGYYYPDERMACLLFKKGLEIPRDALPLYGSPAPSWQGLSDDEIIDMYFQASISPQPHQSIINFIRAIEQALKEKNA